ncbi:MAG: hypothetical protein JWO44_2727 [Bacteroidetes bacterium]|jgi:hypothetical protein|nr:hypothetical protein [Bacteroidota bacterium]
MKTILFSIAFCFAAFCGTAQSNDVELKLTLRDGNVVSGTSKINNIVLVTDYGKLEIPLKNVTSLDLGLSADKADAAKTGSLVKQLSNSDEKLRKSAYDELLKSDIRAVIAISDLVSSSKYEPSTFTDYTAEAALSELQAKYGLDENISAKDVVSIDYEYSIGGVYDFAKIELKTEYGTLSVPKEKIKHIDVLFSGGSENGEVTFKLMGSKHISSNMNGGWLKTGIMVKPGQKLNITASGEITFASLSGSAYKPDGSIAGSPAPAETNTYDSYGAYSSGATYPTYGNVVYKIGENSTQVLKAGAKFNGTASASGMLYLSVYETVYNAANSGSYTVKIALK